MTCEMADRNNKKKMKRKHKPAWLASSIDTNCGRKAIRIGKNRETFGCWPPLIFPNRSERFPKINSQEC